MPWRYFTSSSADLKTIRCYRFLSKAFLEFEITFTTDDIIVPDVPGMFTSFLVKGSPLFVDSRLFDDPGHYAKMMGYDKPIDFKLSNVSPKKINSDGKKDTS
ncbi:transmembrane protein 70 homolog, mitochondrial isoform X2 [Zootermopsis nevadensis]|uniref:transmembrane protein 70 homolog, mitochondrial isoform X2 n=1 Tax=Zootermopsis nevadensis TaxID=136037 RepID=UPI000B8E94DD|nr:transmembrane protein 70 homolog, mitochondrial isoform X2 [Zootermopsis nevadensis]